MAPISLAHLVRDSGQVVNLSTFSRPGRDAMLALPCQRWKPPWDALGENSYGAPPPVPPLLNVSPFDRCSYGACHNSKIEVCAKISGVIIGHSPFSTGDAGDSVRGFLDTEFFMKVVNSIKMKPSEVALRVLWSIRAVHRRLRRVGRSSCRLSRKLECRRP
jgi:hypothetical protein